WLHSLGIAPSGFRPLRKIPYCCLPEEFGPCLSPDVADHPLRSAMHHRLGRPLPHQLTDAPAGHLLVTAEPSFNLLPRPRRYYAVLAPGSEGYPALIGRFLTCYSPLRR